MRSLSFYLTLLVIKLKGIKADFSQDPINFKKLRKDDIHSIQTKGAKQIRVEDSLITQIGNSPTAHGLIIFIHGGAFVYGPAKHHWDFIKKLNHDTSCTIWMVDYPKAPEHKIDLISRNIDHVYDLALGKFGDNKIILIGDSVGGTLVTALTHRLLEKRTPLPSAVILISPVMDSSFNNGEIPALDAKDPMLSKKGALSAKMMCAVEGNLDNPSISPLYGNFINFPQTLLFIAENDITSADQELLARKLRDANVKYKVIRGGGMPHIWPLLPVMKEAKIAYRGMVEEIKRIFKGNDWRIG